MTNILTKAFSFEFETKIVVNPFFWPVIIGALLTGQFIEILTLFGVVIIHEIGHIFSAKSYGWKISEVQLLPFGSVAKVEQTSDSLWEEFIVAVSGPLQNLMMIIVALGFQKVNLWSDDWTTFFIKANTVIGLFNLLPISPLDGSKLLKVFFYLFFSYRKAIMVNIFVSIILTVFFLIWSAGLFSSMKININGMILAVFFVYNNLVDIKQAPYLFFQFLLNRASKPPRRNVSAIPIIVHQDISLMNALRLLRKERYHIFYILSDQGEIVKIVPEEKLLKTVMDKKELYLPISQFIA